MDDVITRYMDMPTTVKGFVLKDSEGDYSIFLNPRLAYDQQTITYRHENIHIFLDHFYKDLPVIEMEEEVYSILSKHND